MAKATNTRPLCPNCKKNEEIKKLINGKFDVYYCTKCFNGFTYPQPKKVEKYYHNQYWSSASFIGNLKDFIFYVFQKRRASWVKSAFSSGEILDVGSGEGIFAKYFPKNYTVNSLEPSWSNVKNSSVIKKDFLKWKTDKKFDAICFWESLEHVPFPKSYLVKTNKLLKAKGKIFIEYPRFNSIEAKIFGKYWFHLDIPRHLSHFTDKGISAILRDAGFNKIKIKNAFSLDYAPWGLTASLVNLKINETTENLKRSGNPTLMVLLLPVAFLSVFIETALFLVNQSPIGLAVAEKNEKT